GIEQGKDCSVGPDAEGERDDGDDGEPGRSAELSYAVAQVLQGGFDPHCAAAFTAIFFDLIEAAELEAGEAAGFAFGYAGTDFVGDLRVKVKAQFLVEFEVHQLARE